MIYSCFDPAVGLYDYFEDDKQIPINGDLPIPKLPSIAGKIGVPAMDAGRPLPMSAKRIGQGWHAKGMIVRCSKSGGIGAADGSISEGLDWAKQGGWVWLLSGAAIIWAIRRL